MKMNQSERKLNTNDNICPECGQKIKNQMNTFILECDRCLSKKTE